jgi:enoyl-CoA hydratase
MTYDNIILEIGEGIATISFNRPKALNALNSVLLKELSSAIGEIKNNEEIRVLILTGAGDKAFVAGADITEIAKLNCLKAKIFAKKGHDILNQLNELPIPVIAAVNGFALGGGTEIALACDFIYASEKAKFGLPEITLGVIPGFGGTQRLSRIIGKNHAKELIFTGKMISAEEANVMGFVNKVCSHDSLMKEVNKTAKMICNKGRVSLRAAKQVIDNGFNVDLLTACNMEVDAFVLCFANNDATEGTNAFLEKRKPVFNGSLNE